MGAEDKRVIVAYEDAISLGYDAGIASHIADECLPGSTLPLGGSSRRTFVGYAPQLEDAIASGGTSARRTRRP